MSDSFTQPYGLSPARLLCPWDFPGKNTGVGNNFLLQGNLPNLRTEPMFPALQVDSLLWSHQGTPWLLVGSIYLESEIRSVESNSLRFHGLYSPWNSLGQNTGVGSLSLLQGDLPNAGIEPRSPALQADSSPAESQEPPSIQAGMQGRTWSQIDFPLVPPEATYFPSNKLEQNWRNYFHSNIFRVPWPWRELVTDCSLAKTSSLCTRVGGIPALIKYRGSILPTSALLSILLKKTLTFPNIFF